MPVASMLMSSLGSSGGGGGSSQGIPNVGSGLISGALGFFQRRKAKKMLSKLQQPVYSVPNEVMENKHRAEIAANEGMPSQQYTNAMRNFKQNESAALSSSLDRRSALMALPKIQRQTNEAMAGLDAQDAAIRGQNQRLLYGINSEIGRYRDKEFDVNRMQPYQRDYGYAMGLLGAGNQNLLTGLDKLFAGGGQLIAGSMGGGKKKQIPSSGEPNYYNDYSANSDYSGFETGF